MCSHLTCFQRFLFRLSPSLAFFFSFRVSVRSIARFNQREPSVSHSECHPLHVSLCVRASEIPRLLTICVSECVCVEVGKIGVSMPEYETRPNQILSSEKRSVI